MRKRKEYFKCVDCKKKKFFYGDGFMVCADLWNKYGVGKKCLCLGCFETRVGRKLIIDDFKEVSSLNDYNYEYWSRFRFTMSVNGEYTDHLNEKGRKKKRKYLANYFIRGAEYFRQPDSTIISFK